MVRCLLGCGWACVRCSQPWGGLVQVRGSSWVLLWGRAIYFCCHEVGSGFGILHHSMRTHAACTAAVTAAVCVVPGTTQTPARSGLCLESAAAPDSLELKDHAGVNDPGVVQFEGLQVVVQAVPHQHSGWAQQLGHPLGCCLACEGHTLQVCS